MRASAVTLPLVALINIFSLVAFVPPAHSQSTGDTPIGPLAIVGTPSSARYCISGNGANVHTIGWVASGTAYVVTIDADFNPATAVTRLDLDGKQGIISYGTPDLRFTTSSAGTLALYVASRGVAGCYRYKVEIQLPPPTAASDPTIRGAILPKAGKSIRPMAISGLASSAKHCVAGQYVADVHSIGRVEAGSLVRISFASDFDAVAGVTTVNPEAQTASYLTDDDGGGNLEPLINYVAATSGTVALFVAGYAGSTGCYQHKVEITPPAAAPSPGPTPGGVALSGIVTSATSGVRISGATVAILDGPNAGRQGTSNSNGEYRIDGLTSSNANASANAAGYTEGRAGTFINGTNVLNFALQPTGGTGGPGTSVAGTWRGRVRTNSCSSDGAFADGCSQVPVISDSLELILSQNGVNVSGTANVGGIRANVTGTVQGTRLVLSGSTVQDGVTVTYDAWDTTVSGTSMTGGFTIRFSASGVPGGVRYPSSLVGVSRVAGATASATASRRGDDGLAAAIAKVAARVR
jgi:hypothetical protein